MALSNKDRQAKWRGRQVADVTAAISALVPGEAAQGLRDALELLSDAGLPVPSADEIAGAEPADAALAVQRLLSAADKGLSLAARRRRLIPVADVTETLSRVAAIVRRNLGTALGSQAESDAQAAGLAPELVSVVRGAVAAAGQRAIAAMATELAAV